MVFESIKGEPRAKKMISGAHAAGKVSGAYIFQGQNTQEMAEFAKEFAKLLNCETVCGTCLNCRKIESGVHPDFITVIPEGKKQIIKIDSIRDLKDRVKLGPVEAKYLMIRVLNADSIESAAANSFLKALEEPPQGVVFVLITSASDNLPRTVLSRCQKIIFANQSQEQTEIPELPKNHDIPALLEFSSGLAQLPKEAERQEAEKRLLALVAHYFDSRDFLKVRIILTAVKDLKKNANIKLLLDRMALSLGGWIKCSE